MTKNDLMELTGISSRVIAKLTKNQTVTTDTLARICEALKCDVGDIMECLDDGNLSLYSRYKMLASSAVERENCKTVRISSGTQSYALYVSKQTANRQTSIFCTEDGSIYWEQVYPIGYVTNNAERYLLIKPSSTPDERTIVIIKGKPGIIHGLDENGFVSSRGTPKKPSDVYVMSETAFKLFEG